MHGKERFRRNGVISQTTVDNISQSHRAYMHLSVQGIHIRTDLWLLNHLFDSEDFSLEFGRTCIRNCRTLSRAEWKCILFYRPASVIAECRRRGHQHNSRRFQPAFEQRVIRRLFLSLFSRVNLFSGWCSYQLNSVQALCLIKRVGFWVTRQEVVL